MMQTLNPYNTAKTAEIMARYRPIAPKPADQSTSSPTTNNNNVENGSISCLPEGIRKSPYLMNVWAHLQARPTRTRKRGRTALAPPFLKRSRTSCLQLQGPSPAPLGFIHDPTGLPQLSLIPKLVPLKCGLDTPVTTPSNAVSLPPLPCSSPTLSSLQAQLERGVIDLNKAAESDQHTPEEMDFMGVSVSNAGPDAENTKFSVIAPQAIRPVGSSIIVGRISDDLLCPNLGKQVVKKPEDVEKEVESEVLPAIVSDSKNRVRLTNAAYNEMVGQPECPWLDFSAGGGACRRRIGGEVVLEFGDSSLEKTSDGFSCWVRIEWGSGKDGKKKKKKNVVNAFCDGLRLACESKDYLFVWRFHPRGASESGSNV